MANKQKQLSFNEFKSKVLSEVNKCPPFWRKGQSVFNVIDDVFGVARIVQFKDGIDCFYDDDTIDEFVSKSYERYKEIMDSEQNN